MSDRELLELAAKAAGYVLADTLEGYPLFVEGEGIWNPLEYDGDALRLAVSLGLLDGGPTYYNFRAQEIFNGLDPFTATRHAIVKAAAEIGKSMP